MNPPRCPPLMLVLAWPLVAQAQPLDTSFTYQGQLRVTGSSTTGAHDLRFRLYDAAIGGSELGGVICFDNVAMSEGRFTVVLDFGSQFAGQQRFLEIEQRADTGLACGDATGFVPLTPRQPLTASPHAIFALNAGNAATATTALNANNTGQLNGQPATFYQNATNLSSGTIPNARLSGTYTGAIALSNAGNSFTGSGGGLTGLNASNIDSGTLADGRLASTYTQALSMTSASNWFVGAFTGGGAGLTGLNASNIDTGTLSPSRLPTPLFLSGANPGIGTIVGTNTATTGAGLRGDATSATGDVAGVQGRSTATAGSGVHGQSLSTSGFAVGVRGEASINNPQGTGMVGTAVATGGWFEASGASGTGLYGVNNAASGPTCGVRGVCASPTGIAIQGEATATSGSGHGVKGLTHSPSGIGVWGNSDAATGTSVGVYGSSDSTGGVGVDGRAWATTGTPIGVRGITSGAGGYGVFGFTTAATGSAVGVRGEVVAGNTSGTGVVGKAAASGGWFEATGTSGTGLFGLASSGTGSTYGVRGSNSSSSGAGIWGLSSATTGNSYGVLGEANSGSAWAVYALGYLGASGSKSFRIDHPADPANRYLLHYTAESPEVINFYRGTVALDAVGEAVVRLPAYFAAINKEPSYTLTAIGTPMPLLHVAEEIDQAGLETGAAAEPGDAVPACSFRIAGGVPGAKVSWRVEAVRNDRWVRRSGSPVEVEKIGTEKGTYQHPDLYGQPWEKAMNHNQSPGRVEP